MDFYQYNESENIEPWLYSLCRCGLTQVANDFHICRTESYPYSNIHLVVSGQFNITFKGNTYIANPGDCFVLPGYRQHEYQVNTDGLGVIQWIEFYGSDSIQLVERIIQLNNSLVISLGHESSNISRLMEALYLKDSIFSKSISIYELLLLFVKIIMDQQPMDLVKKTILFKDLVSYIEQNIGKPLKLVDLSRYSGYSASRLNELFKLTFDATPKQYIYQRRIIMAKKLLHNGDLSLDVIADTLGFYDASHLARRFKEQEGITPKEYKIEINQYKYK